MANVEFTTEELASEEWRPVVGHEGRYEVSDIGRVRSLLKGKTSLLRPAAHKSKKGYLAVTISGRTVTVHRLVATAFLGPKPPLLPDEYQIEVNHKDAVKTNNRARNLEWVTRRENARHAARMGLMSRPNWLRGDRAKGSNRHGAKLTEAIVETIKRRLAIGDQQKLIARDFGVTPSTVFMIAHGKRWKHVNIIFGNISDPD